MQHVVVDLETLSNDVRHGVIISIGAVSFTMDNSVPMEQPSDRLFYRTVERASQLQLGMTEDEATYAWWTNTEEKKTLLESIIYSSDRISLTSAFIEFGQWLAQQGKHGEVMLWSHGVTYDCMHLSEKWPIVMGKKFNDVCPYKLMRDTRTLFAVYEAAVGHELWYIPPKIKHHALEDAVATAVSVQHAWNTLTGGKA